MTEGIRLQKYLSRAGRASRREAERLMLEGRVRVNGEVASELGFKVVPGRDRVELDGESVELSPARWIAFYKPVGVLTTRSDPHGGRTIYDLLPDELHGLKYVGRLDRDAEGLLLMTNDGDAAHAVQHPSGEVEREYWVEAAGSVESTVVQRLRSGVELEDGLAVAQTARVLQRGDITSEVVIVLTVNVLALFITGELRANLVTPRWIASNVGAVFGLIGTVAMFVYAVSIARRLPEDRLVFWTRVIMWGVVASGGVRLLNEVARALLIMSQEFIMPPWSSIIGGIELGYIAAHLLLMLASFTLIVAFGRRLRGIIRAQPAMAA